ncbi:hypothetical protein [Candidatus Nitrotoga sp. M5]|uniref:hypothetical protein n=1 Tax=Candidatus Nitrotoga sp. M5 TaxID=2890409 RepID=UPI001EF1888A|nr:hypothetical protein [Candidatus Nitrotoga sp. M5]
MGRWLIPEPHRHTAKGGTVVCAGIHMSDVPGFPYSILWEGAHYSIHCQSHSP